MLGILGYSCSLFVLKAVLFKAEIGPTAAKKAKIGFYGTSSKISDKNNLINISPVGFGASTLYRYVTVVHTPQQQVAILLFLTNIPPFFETPPLLCYCIFLGCEQLLFNYDFLSVFSPTRRRRRTKCQNATPGFLGAKTTALGNSVLVLRGLWVALSVWMEPRVSLHSVRAKPG